LSGDQASSVDQRPLRGFLARGFLARAFLARAFLARGFLARAFLARAFLARPARPARDIERRVFLVRVAPRVEPGRTAPRRQADGAGAQQLAHPRGELLPARQFVAVAGPQLFLGGEPLPGFRRSGVLEPAIGVRDVVTEEVINQVQSARGGIAARERGHNRTLAAARYEPLTKNPLSAL
jgi:hypothetical protein